jgi:hypothetical protein
MTPQTFLRWPVRVYSRKRGDCASSSEGELEYEISNPTPNAVSRGLPEKMTLTPEPVSFFPVNKKQANASKILSSGYRVTGKTDLGCLTGSDNAVALWVGEAEKFYTDSNLARNQSPNTQSARPMPQHCQSVIEKVGMPIPMPISTIQRLFFRMPTQANPVENTDSTMIKVSR